MDRAFLIALAEAYGRCRDQGEFAQEAYEDRRARDPGYRPARVLAAEMRQLFLRDSPDLVQRQRRSHRHRDQRWGRTLRRLPGLLPGAIRRGPCRAAAPADHPKDNHRQLRPRPDLP